MRFVSKTILLISPEPWGSNFVSKHHYAITLAERGNRVFFLNPPGHANRVAEVKENLWVVDYRAALRGLNKLPVTLRKPLMKFDANKLKAKIGKVDVVWSFDPYRLQNLKLFDNQLAIFHPVDVHANNKLVNQIAASADIVLTVSAKILATIHTNVPEFKINHGLAKQFCENSNQLPASQPHPVKVGYVGNLHSHYIDKPILKQLIAEHPDVIFHFIGPYKKSNLSGLSRNLANQDLVDFISNQNNCHLIGPINTEQMPEMLALFDLTLLCYTGDKNVVTISNSHKVLEYLSTGKVVVSNYIDEYKDKRHLLEMVEDNTQLPQKFSEVINNLNHYNSPEKQQARQAWARENTYEKQVERIEKLLAKVLK